MSESTRFYTADEMKTGVRVMNTRIVEIFNKQIKKNVLSIGNSYYEFNRMGTYHGYWTVVEAIKIRDYLTKWIDRQKILETRDEENGV